MGQMESGGKPKIINPAASFTEHQLSGLKGVGLDLSPGLMPKQKGRLGVEVADLKERRPNLADLAGKIAVIGAFTRDMTEVVGRTAGRPAIGYQTEDGVWTVYEEPLEKKFIALDRGDNSLRIPETVAAVRLDVSKNGAYPRRVALGSSYMVDMETREEVFEPVNSSIKTIVDTDAQVVGKYAEAPILPHAQDKLSVAPTVNLV